MKTLSYVAERVLSSLEPNVIKCFVMDLISCCRDRNTSIRSASEQAMISLLSLRDGDQQLEVTFSFIFLLFNVNDYNIHCYLLIALLCILAHSPMLVAVSCCSDWASGLTIRGPKLCAVHNWSFSLEEDDSKLPWLKPLSLVSSKLGIEFAIQLVLRNPLS